MIVHDCPMIDACGCMQRYVAEYRPDGAQPTYRVRSEITFCSRCCAIGFPGLVIGFGFSARAEVDALASAAAAVAQLEAAGRQRRVELVVWITWALGVGVLIGVMVGAATAAGGV